MKKQKIFKFKNRSLILGQKTYIMGIINVTPDSFSDGGVNLNAENAVKTALDMEKAGADILDIGGQSTRPGHTVISAEEEWNRLKDVLPQILKVTTLPVSVDTFYPEVAVKALEMGCHIINDVSGNVNPQMIEAVKKYSAGIVLMHSGTEKGDLAKEIGKRLKKMLSIAMKMGLKREYICLDAGLGFGKTEAENFEIINAIQKCKVKGNAFLVGASRKRFVTLALSETKPSLQKRDIATAVVNTAAILGGADIIRVHNVKMAVESVNVADAILKKGGF